MDRGPRAVPEVIPAHVPDELVRRVDHHNDAAALADPVGFMDPLRERYRVFYSTAFEGFWVVTRYADQREVFQDPERFSSDPIGIPGGPGYGGLALLPIQLDPPEHTKYRSLINPVFAPRRIVALEEKARTIARGLVDETVERGETEFITDYAEVLPTRIFTDMLGLPYEEHEKFLDWNNALLHSSMVGDGLAARRQAGEAISAYLVDLIAERYRERRDDIVSVLIDSEVDGERLTEHEVLRAAFLLFMAGLDTVTAAHGWIFRFLAENPDRRAELIAEPELVDSAIEELLRYHAFVNDARTVTADSEEFGVQMRQGDRILLHSGSACRDAREFDEPLTIDFRRKPNRHLAFAAGPHRCVGSHLARMELKVSVQEWLRRIPEFGLGPGDITAHCGGVAGLNNLPLVVG